MNLFDILGPIMVGPSSSHTAGAARIGFVGYRLLGETPVKAKIELHGSFASTGKGHGTDKALVAGLLGMRPDDIRIPRSFEIAQERGMAFEITSVYLKDVHPNSVRLTLTGRSGKTCTMIASSLGGGRIKVCNLEGIEVSFSGEYPTLIVNNEDKPGCVTRVTSLLSQRSINIATMQLYRDTRGGEAVMVIECDQGVPEQFLQELKSLDGIKKVTYLNMEEE